jgi:hypothetical protein
LKSSLMIASAFKGARGEDSGTPEVAPRVEQRDLDDLARHRI